MARRHTRETSTTCANTTEYARSLPDCKTQQECTGNIRHTPQLTVTAGQMMHQQQQAPREAVAGSTRASRMKALHQVAQSAMHDDDDHTKSSALVCCCAHFTPLPLHCCCGTQPCNTDYTAIAVHNTLPQLSPHRRAARHCDKHVLLYTMNVAATQVYRKHLHVCPQRTHTRISAVHIQNSSGLFS